MIYLLIFELSQQILWLHLEIFSQLFNFKSQIKILRLIGNYLIIQGKWMFEIELEYSKGKLTDP